MFTLASCVHCVVKAAAQCYGLGEKMTSTTSKNNIGPLSVSEPKTEIKINNQLKILKEQANKLFDDGKGDFFYGGRFTQGRLTHSYPIYRLR